MAQKPVIFLAFANDKVENARYLRNLPTELDGIRKTLARAVQEGLCEVVERANAGVNDIFDIFQDARYKDRIAVFHYGGHADGYQLLLESASGGHEVAHGEGLVSFLSGQKALKLIFFNGCSTQQQALELIEAGVPLVVGTSQAIDDEVATTLALRFYQGLGSGASIARAWQEATDQIKTLKGSKNTRGMYRKSDKEATAERFPWDMHLRAGAEIVREWNLPEAVDNPLFGMPEIPPIYDLPDTPYLFLSRYERKHAGVFFGRSYYIRDLYNRITSQAAAPLILLYGQTGVGKSSLMDAGLVPRLEHQYDIRYTRRNRELGLSGTLRACITGETGFSQGSSANTNGRQALLQQVKQLKSIAIEAPPQVRNELEEAIARIEKKLDEERNSAPKEPDDSRHTALWQLWRQQEKQSGKPLVIVLDQVEEVFTQPNPRLNAELKVLVENLSDIFYLPQHRPQGKIILSYRKEYSPEIEEMLKAFEMPRERVFLKHLDRKDIVEVVQGLSLSESLRQRYGLKIQENLPVIIADDLLEDKESSIAPVLQILLTKMWELSAHDDERFFSVSRYQELRKGGLLLDDFLHQQMAALRKMNPNAVESGLALDLLHYHTTPMGTSDTWHYNNIALRYQHKPDIALLLEQCKTLYLLTDRGNQISSLAHDTLAPLIRNDYKNSDKYGQRAARILENKILDYKNDKRILLDSTDLTIVEAGEKGMRKWNPDETELIERSRRRRRRIGNTRRALIGAGMLAALMISLLGLLSYRQGQIATRARENAEASLRKEEEARRQQLIALQDAQKAEAKAEREAESAVKARDSTALALKRAEISTLRALEKEGEAQLAAVEETRQRKIATEKAYLGKISELEAARNAFRARLQGYTARLSQEESQFREYLSKAKELAVLSTIVNSNEMQQLLALSAYRINQEAYRKLSKASESTQIVFRNEARIFEQQVSILQDEFDSLEFDIRRMLAPRGAPRVLPKRSHEVQHPKFRETQSLQQKLSQIGNTIQQPLETPEIFDALRKAYLQKEKLAKDYVQEAESWSLMVDNRNELVYANPMGHIYKAILLKADDRLPMTSTPTRLYGEVNTEPRTLLVAGNQIFCGTRRGEVFMMSNNALLSRRNIAQHQGVILAMVYAQAKQTLYYSVRNEVYAYHLPTAKHQLLLRSKGNNLRSLQIIEQGEESLLLAGDDAGFLYQHSAGESQTDVLYQFPAQYGGLHAMAYNPAKKWLAIGTGRGQVLLFSGLGSATRLQEANFSRPVVTEQKHKGIVQSLSFSPDGSFIASGGLDGGLFLWSLKGIVSAQELGRRMPLLHLQNDEKIFAMSFDSRSDYLLFNDEKHLRICPTRQDVFYYLLCTGKFRQLSTEEWNQFVGPNIPQKDCLICQTPALP